MTAAGEREAPRWRDTAVILARGASRRMGFPKGLYRPDGGGPTLLERVAGLYRALGWPVALVTHPAGERAYRPVAGDLVEAWVVTAPGGDTAASCLAAAAALGTAGRRFWFHPVDLPAVREATVRRLLAAATRDPGAVWVPRCGAARGHPVAVPGHLLAPLAGRRPPGRMADLMIRHGWPLRFLPVDDPGCVRDVDRLPDA